MADETPICALCDRPLGQKKERHHLVPRLKGGKKTVLLHPICHRKIHALFTEAQLARSYATVEALQAQPEISTFVKWLDGKPPDFYAPTRRARGKSR
ncbi:MAG: HNH endonuclease [Alphaproteobacteria bacterium]